MDYKETLNLPKTDFPMKANLAKKEVEILQRWEEMNLYDKLMETGRDREKFVFHDGPPYANGHIHSGHALNKILKDFVVKIKTMSGYNVPFTPGWDCHGLPIEHQVDKQLGKSKNTTGPVEKRALCREYAGKYVEIQKEEFKRLGVIADWDNPYLTMSREYEIGIIKELVRFVANGALYRDFKPVHWCASCRTALAEAEVEYAPHTSPSIYVTFRLADDDAGRLGLNPGAAHIVIWTTTPWTLPANLAISLHPDFDYNAVTAGEKTFIMAEDLTGACMSAFGIESWEVTKKFKGAQMEGMKARHPFLERDALVILGDHVTLEQGTGCVHTAPGHGQEDYVVGRKYGLDIYNPVDDGGRFMPDTEHFASLNVWKANEPIIAMLEENGALLARSDISHSYPHCWRCRKPLIFRATAQWFISMETNGLRQKSLEAIRTVKWMPGWGEERIYGMVENRPDWCVSRQRTWGAPIIAFHCVNCGSVLLNEKTACYVAGLMEKDGLDIWFAKPAEELLEPGAKCAKCGAADFEKGRDILDVWFDSGVSHAVVVERDKKLTWPADLYLEGSDQHRGWFHTSLLESVATRGSAPYRQVLTHGYVVDGAGKKMSKSLGNVIAPGKIIERYGAEIIRLWVAGEDYREDIRLSNEIMSRLTEAYRKIRNTIRFMLGNLNDFDPEADLVPFDDRAELDRVILVRFHRLIQKVTSAFDNYEFHVFYHSFHNFCIVDLSAFYLDIIKDRLYTYPTTSAGRRSAQSTLHELVHGMLRLMAPVLAFTAEEAWGRLPGTPETREPSVHLARFPEPALANIHDTMMAEWDRISVIRSEVSQALETARKEKTIGHSLDARVEISAFQSDRELLEKRIDDLPFIFIVSQVELVAEPHQSGLVYRSEKTPGMTIKVGPADGEKCERCWNYSRSVGQSAQFPGACSRCVDHLSAK